MTLGAVTALTLATIGHGDVITFRGTCDGSAAVALGGGLIAVANDEDNVIRVYRSSGTFISEIKSPNLGPKEADVEGAARIGSKTYWLTSHARNQRGEAKPERKKFFAAAMAPGGDSLEAAGTATTTLLEALLQQVKAVDSELGRQLEAGTLLAAEAAGGFNIEGLASGPDDSLLVGLRNPTPSRQAVVIPFENPAEVLDGKAARFGRPDHLDLGGLGIRSLERVGDSYLIVAGPPGDGKQFRLYRWDGRDQVQLLLDLSRVPPLADLSPEALVETGPGRVLILSDDGDLPIGGVACKKAPPEDRAFRGVELSIE